MNFKKRYEFWWQPQREWFGRVPGEVECALSIGPGIGTMVFTEQDAGSIGDLIFSVNHNPRGEGFTAHLQELFRDRS